MDTVWTFRMIFAMALFVLLFGDYLEYRSDKSKDITTMRSSNTANSIQEQAQSIDLNEDTSVDEITKSSKDGKINLDKKFFQNHKLAAQKFTDECLPKMLCQMAAKPTVLLSDRERSLLDLIRSTTLSLAWNSAPTKWHFATHMGQLMQYTSDSIAGPMGCALLWPQCPISSQNLFRLSSKLILK